MALSLGMDIGERLIIGESTLRVTDIVQGYIFTLDVDGKEYVVADKDRVQILPEVFVRSGLNRENIIAQRSGRLALEAPRTVSIRRT
jgi:hypothetical protein